MPPRAQLLCRCRPQKSLGFAPAAQARTFATPSAGESSKRHKRHDFQQQQRSFHASSRTLATPRDPYGTLGISKDASTSEIKKAYYKLAKQYHPDTKTGREHKERFVEIQNAYDILGDETKRQAFDRYGPAAADPNFDAEAHARASAGGFGDFFGGGGRASQSQSDIFDSLFNAFGGGGQRQRGPVTTPGEDIAASVTVTFSEAAKGTTRKIPVNRVVQHAQCNGSGLKPGMTRTTCPTCRGSGQIAYQVQGGFNIAATCTTCRGSGTTTPKEALCTGCGGEGKVRERTTVDVNITAGVEDGMRVVLTGKGDAPLEGKGPPGDLFVKVQVIPSKIFRRQGANIYLDKAIPFYTAMTGGKVKVPTLDQDVDVRVPGGSQPGDSIVLRGAGMPRVTPGSRGSKGDLTIKFNVTLPKSLSANQKALLDLLIDDIEGRKPTYSSPIQEEAAETASLTASSTSADATSPLEPEPSTPEASAAEPAAESSQATESEKPKDPPINRQQEQQELTQPSSLLGVAWSGLKSIFGR